MQTKAPNTHIMMLINYLALFPLVYFIPEWLAPMIGSNKLVHTALVLAIIVPIISYFVMPLAVKALTRK